MTMSAINRLKAKLYKLMDEGAPYEEILMASQRLDRLINRVQWQGRRKGVKK
jgi:hypothetical protein